jgi:hypothetical protein
MRPIAALLLLPALAALPGLSQTVTHACPPVSDAFVIDGKLDEAGWKGLDSLPLVMNNNPTGGKPGVATQVLAAWSKTRLYVAFVAYTRNVKATITKHDGELYTEDVVEMFIDPDGDGKNYMELEWNCLNTSLDFEFAGVRTGDNTGWAPAGMQNAVSVRGTANHTGDVDTSYTVEISIPWDALKTWSKGALPPKAGDKLPINFYRIDHPAKGVENLMAWSPTGAADFHRPDKFGQLIFSETAAATSHSSGAAACAGGISGGITGAAAFASNGRTLGNTSVTLSPSVRFWTLPSSSAACSILPGFPSLR